MGKNYEEGKSCAEETREVRERIGPDENILSVIIHYRLSLMDIKTNSFFRLSKYIKLTDETRKIDFIILIDYTITKWRDDDSESIVSLRIN